MREAYDVLFNGALVVLAILLFMCLIRAIRGPRISDRIVAVNMMGTLIVIIICVLAFLMGEGYLVDVAIIYTMLSFLAVVLLTKVYMGIYRQKRREEKEDEKHA
jgi:multicomponent Na+:H+ antiporter subunit F